MGGQEVHPAAILKMHSRSYFRIAGSHTQQHRQPHSILSMLSLVPVPALLVLLGLASKATGAYISLQGMPRRLIGVADGGECRKTLHTHQFPALPFKSIAVVLHGARYREDVG
jgi:hypothetical protein